MLEFFFNKTNISPTYSTVEELHSRRGLSSWQNRLPRLPFRVCKCLKPLNMSTVPPAPAPRALEWLKHLLDSSQALNFAHFLAVAGGPKARPGPAPAPTRRNTSQTRTEPSQEAGASVKVQVALVATPGVRHKTEASVLLRNFPYTFPRRSPLAH